MDVRKNQLATADEERKKKAWNEGEEFKTTLGQLFDSFSREDAGPAGPMPLPGGPQAQVPFAAAGNVDPVVAGALAPMPEVDPFANFPAPSKSPSAMDLQNAARFQLPQVPENPRIALLDKRISGVRGLMAKYPAQIESVSPILTDLERQKAALAKGDQDLADAWEESLQRRYDALSTGYRETQANARNAATNATKNVQAPDPTKVENMTPSQILASIDTYKAMVQTISERGDPEGKQAQAMIGELAKLAAEYNRRGVGTPINPIADIYPELPVIGDGSEGGGINWSAWGARLFGGGTAIGKAIAENRSGTAAAPAASNPNPAAPTAGSTKAQKELAIKALGDPKASEAHKAAARKILGL